jgi:hypothetical protein
VIRLLFNGANAKGLKTLFAKVFLHMHTVTLMKESIGDNVNWQELLTAFLAGGVGWQLITVLWRAHLSARNEFSKWRIEQRYILFSQLLTLVTYVPESTEKLESWTHDIRDISLRLHILFDNGTAPKGLEGAIEQVFQLARDKKRGDNTSDWSDSMRFAVRELRKNMAENFK